MLRRSPDSATGRWLHDDNDWRAPCGEPQAQIRPPRHPPTMDDISQRKASQNMKRRPLACLRLPRLSPHFHSSGPQGHLFKSPLTRTSPIASSERPPRLARSQYAQEQGKGEFVLHPTRVPRLTDFRFVLRLTLVPTSCHHIPPQQHTSSQEDVG